MARRSHAGYPCRSASRFLCDAFFTNENGKFMSTRKKNADLPRQGNLKNDDKNDERYEEKSHTKNGETSGEISGEASNETSNETSRETSSETSSETRNATSGETSGETSEEISAGGAARPAPPAKPNPALRPLDLAAMLMVGTEHVAISSEENGNISFMAEFIDPA
jgi:hypothetical protein